MHVKACKNKCNIQCISILFYHSDKYLHKTKKERRNNLLINSYFA